MDDDRVQNCVKLYKRKEMILPFINELASSILTIEVDKEYFLSDYQATDLGSSYILP